MTVAAGRTPAEEVVAGIQDMYDGYLTNDRARFDSHLDAAATTWESHFPQMLSRQELDEFRDRRTDAERQSLELMRVDPLHVEVVGDMAFAAYLLVTRAPGGPEVQARITDVLHRVDGEWRIIHHHAQGDYSTEGED